MLPKFLSYFRFSGLSVIPQGIADYPCVDIHSYVYGWIVTYVDSQQGHVVIHINKTDSNDKTEILLQIPLNTRYSYCWVRVCS